MTGRERAGVVLAGGRSRRFGRRDKALARIEGEPMLARVVGRLSRVTGPVVVSCRADQRSRFDSLLPTAVRFAVDPVPDRGPLAGLATALCEVDAAYAAVLGCDAPGADPEFIEYLFGRAAGRDGAVPEGPDGHLRPAHAVYRAPVAREQARTRLATGSASLSGLVDSLDVAVVDAETVATQTDPRTLRDVNTRAELRRFERSRN